MDQFPWPGVDPSFFGGRHELLVNELQFTNLDPGAVASCGAFGTDLMVEEYKSIGITGTWTFVYPNNGLKEQTYSNYSDLDEIPDEASATIQITN